MKSNGPNLKEEFSRRTTPRRLHLVVDEGPIVIGNAAVQPATSIRNGSTSRGSRSILTVVQAAGNTFRSATKSKNRQTFTDDERFENTVGSNSSIASYHQELTTATASSLDRQHRFCRLSYRLCDESSLVERNTTTYPICSTSSPLRGSECRKLSLVLRFYATSRRRARCGN